MASVIVDFAIKAKPDTAEVVRTLTVGDSSVDLPADVINQLVGALGQDRGFHTMIEVADAKIVDPKVVKPNVK